MYSRHKYNSDKEYRESLDWYRDIARYQKEAKEEQKKLERESHRKWLEEQGLKFIDSSEDSKKNFHGECDHPNTMENGPATLLYIIVMIGGAIFVDRLLIWIVSTIIYFKFITRHKK